MLSIGFTDESSRNIISFYAKQQGYNYRNSDYLSGKTMLYLIQVDNMEVKQSEELNEIAKNLPGLEWLSDLEGHYEGVARAMEDLY